jgi:hypothetical protein
LYVVWERWVEGGLRNTGLTKQTCNRLTRFKIKQPAIPAIDALKYSNKSTLLN